MRCIPGGDSVLDEAPSGVGVSLETAMIPAVPVRERHIGERRTPANLRAIDGSPDN